ncbi:hypothetical protein BZA05DRAFT_424330 [Tricharina praecox]|uniref:uncharacterized protein n=1 Tax=Tricharina praecox TaxID=43433 RepID=UPI00221FE9C2|nr:uncharacterized protein BZA05DRAFT_424330 [Tricharina praecox]KAI5855788.1 hypothetical protein BZA05DRAFT_424330 [Tricharina praecox]
MADQNVAALLAALSNTQLPQGFPGLPAALGASTAQQPQQSVNSPPTGFALPQPTASGSLDLSKIKPTASGRVSLDDALAKVKAKAAEMGVHRDPSSTGTDSPRYDDPRARYGRRSRSRSRSPPARRGPDPYRDAYSTFRDERRGRTGAEYGRDRERSFSPQRRGGSINAYSPPPRGERFGSHRTRSPPPDMEQINIDASLVGLIIGRGGENLRRVESETGARVQFMTNGHDRDSGGERVCNIQGTRPQITAARRAIDLIIQENEKSGGAGPPARKPAPAPSAYGGMSQMNQGPGPAGPGAPNLRDGEESTQIFVPDRTVGLIIGRGGETIRDIQDKSGCHVNIVGEAKSQNGQRPVNLIGSAQASEYARRLIMEIVESDTNGGPPGPPVRAPPSQQQQPPPQQQQQQQQQQQHYGGGGDGGGGTGPRITETIKVPIDAVGMIIGKGGETIKEMQNSTGCRINVSSQFNPNDQEREISLAGNRDAIARARQAIDEKVEASSWGGYGGGQSAAAPTPAAAVVVAPAADDPYAAYGGYQAYCAMYYAAVLQQQAAAGSAPGASGPPGT